MHSIDSKLLVAVHFLSKEEQEELVRTTQPRMEMVKTTQPRMLIRRSGEEGESGEAFLPTRNDQDASIESTFTSVAMKVQISKFLDCFAIS